MALPTLLKAWNFSVNQTTSGTSIVDSFQKLMYKIKTILTGFGWTVVGSSNGSAAGMDAVDRWSSSSALTWGYASTARSWIVLKNTGMGSNFQLLISLYGTSSVTYYRAVIAFSPAAGFVGASTTTNPTATDQVSLVNQGGWFTNPSGTTGFNAAIHAMQSTDGKNFRLFLYQGGFSVAYWCLETLRSPVTGFTYPIIGTLLSNDSANSVSAPGKLTIAQFTDNSAITQAYHGGAFNCYYTTESANSIYLPTQLTARANGISGEWGLIPIGIMSLATLQYGRHGYIPDLYWGITNAFDGYTYANSGSRDWVQFCHLVTPWVGGSTYPILMG